MKLYKSTLLLLFLICCGPVRAQRSCGIEAEKAAMIARDSSWVRRFDEQRASLQSIADNYKKMMGSHSLERVSSTVAPVPVIFHIIVDTQQYMNMGGEGGIIRRVDSQIVVLNRDYNCQNADSSMIPSSWKALYSPVGVHFALAHTDPNGKSTPGYEILTTDYQFTAGPYNDYSDAKSAINGLAGWDDTRYMNVWCISFSDNPGLLGITCPKSFTVGSGAEPAADEGVCINYLALGCQTVPASLNFPSGGNYSEGRTLTHEVGHFFEIWHTWGDDRGLCPWQTPVPCPNGGDPTLSGVGYDDGLGDTPPEGDHQYGNPAYTIPGGTYYDCCEYNPNVAGGPNMQPIGIASLSFINYTDDDAMHMFTADQAAAMASMVLVPPSGVTGATGSGTVGESYSLTQNPGLLDYPSVGITNFDVYPNPSPATGNLTVTFDSSSDKLVEIQLTNAIGQLAAKYEVTGTQAHYYTFPITGLAAGIYFIRCTFASGIVTRKISIK